MPLRRSLGLCTATALFALAGLAGTLAAQAKPAAGALQPLTPEAALNLRTLSDLQYSPDGARLAFVVTEPPKGEGRARHIWVLDEASGAMWGYEITLWQAMLPLVSEDKPLFTYDIALSDLQHSRHHKYYGNDL